MPGIDQFRAKFTQRDDAFNPFDRMLAGMGVPTSADREFAAYSANLPEGTYPVRPMGAVTGTDDTLRDTLTEAMAVPLESAGFDGRGAYSEAGKLMSLAEMNPAVGAAMSAGDTYDAYKRGDQSGMEQGALFTALNAAGIKPLAAAMKGGMRARAFPWGDFDPFKPEVR